MSLHIGNISSRIRRDELERVFRKFGPCNVRMKGAYGFVVYEFPPNAEEALRALHKRTICGERLTLSWSNKQPRPSKRFARTARSYEPQHGRDSDRGRDYASRKFGSSDRQDYRVKINQTDSNGGRVGSVDVHEEETANHQVDFRDHASKESQVYRDDFRDEDCRVEPELVENDRWGDQFHDPPNETGVENGVGFDRYDPYQGHDKKNDDENLQEAYSGVSPALRISQENLRRDHIGKITSSHPNDAKFQETCYKCGRSGHKRRNCPQKNASQRKFTRFDHRHSDDRHKNGGGKGELERFGFRSWEKHESSRDLLPGRRTENDKNSSGSGRHERLMRSGRSAVVKETDRSWKEEYERKNRSRKEIESPKRQRTKKARRSSLSPLHSDYTAARFHTISSSTKDLQRSHSRSGSKSVSSSSRSVSISHHSRSKSSKTRSRSSSPTSLSLSVSLGRPLLSLSTKAQMNVKGSSDNATTPESKEVLIEEVQEVEGDACLESAKLEKEMVVVNNGNAVSSSNASDGMEKDQPLHNNNDSLQVVSDLLPKATDPSVLLSDKSTPATGNPSPERVLEMERQNSDSFMMEHVPIPMKKPDSEAPAVPSSVHSTTISTEELSMVLNHYGIDCQGENEKHLPAEAYFGSARLWPWEIIYYRRLKKGLISIENYARRVDQNREFGIVDKYIRSSSGWGELHQENP